MSENKQDWRNELDALLARLVDEELNPTETARLNEILRDEPEACEEYHAYLDVHEGLGEQLSAPDFTALDKVVAPEPEPSYLRPVLAMAALMVIGFFINFLMTQSAQKPVAIAKVKALSGSLVYTGDRGLVRNIIKEGDSLEGGTIEGMTPDAWFELEFDDGSTVMISGNSMLTFSDDGQKKLRLQEGGFSANVKPQPKDRPMLVQTRTAIFEVLGTRFSVDAEQTTATLTVSEGRVRVTRLSDNLSVDVPAKHRVVASQDHELTPKRLPDSVSIWESRIERGSKEGNGEWVPAQEGEPAHLRAIPYTISANIDKKQRTIYTISTRVSQKDSPPVILKPGSRIRVQGKMDTPHAIWFGVTLRRPNGDFAGHFQIIVPAERFQPGEPFDVTLNPEEYHLDPSLKKWAADLAKNPFDLKVGSVWCHSLWDSVGLKVSKMQILAPEESKN
tara:strand:+ start:688 stop:2028 length:1341 start_codon:yes stop_codon:yes gene_type:complete